MPDEMGLDITLTVSGYLASPRRITVNLPHFLIDQLTQIRKDTRSTSIRNIHTSTIANARLGLISRNIMTSDLARRFGVQTVNYFAGTHALKSMIYNKETT